MNAAEAAFVIAAMRVQIDELEERVAELELRVAGGHNCLIDINCDLDEVGRCRLKPHDYSDDYEAVGA